MALIPIKLSRINGNIEPGITVGVSESLPEDKKLPIIVTDNQPLPISVVKQNALIWALNIYSENTATQLFLNGIAALIDCGLLCESDGYPDGDWFKSTFAFRPTKAAIESIVEIVNIESMQKALTVVTAIKADFWSTNHQINQGSYTDEGFQIPEYTKKVLIFLYPNAVSYQVVSAARSLGCYASTLYVLRMAGIAGIRVVQPFVKNKESNFTLSDKSKLRFQTMPAGTDKLDIACKAAKRLVRNMYAPFCLDVTDFEILPPMYNRVMESPANYHIRASYLTGQPRADYQDSDMDKYLGRLGIFIITLYKYSIVAKSPHMTREKVEEYPDYDIDFKAKLIRIRDLQAATRGHVPEEHMSEMAVTPKAKLDMLREAFRTARI